MSAQIRKPLIDWAGRSSDHADPYRRLFKVPKWNGPITVLEDHRLFRRLPEFAGYARADHDRIARAALAMAIVGERAWGSLAARGLEHYGDHGPLISGVIRDHFPEADKDLLRRAARDYSFQYSRSIAHWQAAGRRVETWRRLRDSWQAIDRADRSEVRS